MNTAPYVLQAAEIKQALSWWRVKPESKSSLGFLLSSCARLQVGFALISASLIFGAVVVATFWWFVAIPWLLLLVWGVVVMIRMQTLGGLVKECLQLAGNDLVTIHFDEAGLTATTDGSQVLYKWQGVVDFVELAEVWAIRVKPEFGLLIIPKRAFESKAAMELFGKTLKMKQNR